MAAPHITQPLVGILGASLGTGNRGVSALGASLIKLMAGAAPEAQAVMLIGNRNSHSFQLIVDGTSREVPVVNYRMSPKSALRENLLWIACLALAYRLVPFRWWRRLMVCGSPWIRTLEEATLVGDIRGGDSFSDIYGLRGFLLSSLPVMTVIWVRGGIVLFPQTYGPYKHALARTVARYILRHANVILSRDQESMETVRQLIGPSEKIRFCPDVAFCLDAVRPAQPAIEPPLPNQRPECLVGLNVNGLMFNGGYTRQNMFSLKLDYRIFLRKLIEALLREPAIHVLLVPHTFAATGNVESDPQASRELLLALPKDQRHRVHFVTHEYDQHELKGIIGQCDFFIGSRMHSCIAALSQGIPTVGVAYSKKFKGVFESVGAGTWVVDGRQTDAKAGVSAVLSMLERRADMRKSLFALSTQAQVVLRETFSRLFLNS